LIYNGVKINKNNKKMNESYRKMNETIKLTKDQEWMGKTGSFNKKVPYGNDKGWIGEVPTKRIV
jgi:hypothetical protein